VRRRSRSWTSRLAVALALVVGLTFVAPPASTAADAGQAAPPAPQRLAAAAAARVAAMSPAPRALAQAQGTPAPSDTGESKHFFRTPTGIAALVLMVAGATYVAVNIHKDNGKVHSPIR
jgi:hypothetical protein